MEKNDLTTSSADIKERWLRDLAPKYFNMTDINLLNVGLFGYINEIMSSSLEDTLNSSSMYYNEVIPATAKLPQSIYAYASMTDDEDFNYTPASVPIALAIRSYDIINKATDTNTRAYKTFRIYRDTQITIDSKLTYMLDYDIEIIVKETPSGYVLTPVYDLDNLNERSDIRNKYIKSVVSKSDGEDYLFMRLTVRQMEKERKTIMVSGRDTVDTLSFDVPFNGNLSHFNVFYQESTSSPLIALDKYFMDNLNPNDDSKFCFYEYENSNKLRIFFSPYESFFRPENGSKLYVDVYTTKGSEGNMTYKGDNIMVKFDTANNIGNDYKGLSIGVRISGESKGGRDGKDTNEIKKLVKESFTTRKGLINENDLNIFFNKYKQNSEVSFFKKRDDVLSRLYSAFILMKDESNNILPTNTIDITISEKDTIDSSSNFTIKAGRYFENNKTQLGRAVEEINREIISAKEETGNYILSNPYLIQIEKNPMMCKYFLNSMYDTSLCSHTYMNYNTLNEFIINSVSFERDAIYKGEDIYTLSFSLNSSLSAEVMNNVATGKTKDLLVKGIIKTSNNDIALFNCTPKSYNEKLQRMEFTATLKTTDYIDEDSSIEMTNLQSIYSIGGTPSFFIPNTDVRIELLVYYNGYEDKTKEKLNHLVELKDYALVTIFETDDEIKFIKDLSSILRSFCKLEEENGEYNIVLKSVPMIRTMYISSTEIVKGIYENLNYHSKLLIDNIDRLENNFDMDFKFYNTYGSSKYFKTNKGDTLDKINLSLKFRIKLIIPVTSEITYNIKNYIHDYVETNSSDVNKVYISNLMSDLKQNFTYISYVEFIGINDYDQSVQTIESSIEDYNDLSKSEIVKYIPEHININKSYDKLTGNLVPEIQIQFI